MKFVTLELAFIKASICFFEGSFSCFFSIFNCSLVDRTVFENYFAIYEFAIFEMALLGELFAFENAYAVIQSVLHFAFIIVTIMIDNLAFFAITVFKDTL